MAAISIRWVSACARVTFRRDARIPSGDGKKLQGSCQRGLDEREEKSRHRIYPDGGEHKEHEKTLLARTSTADHALAAQQFAPRYSCDPEQARREQYQATRFREMRCSSPLNPTYPILGFATSRLISLTRESDTPGSVGRAIAEHNFSRRQPTEVSIPVTRRVAADRVKVHGRGLQTANREMAGSSEGTTVDAGAGVK